VGLSPSRDLISVLVWQQVKDKCISGLTAVSVGMQLAY